MKYSQRVHEKQNTYLSKIVVRIGYLLWQYGIIKKESTDGYINVHVSHIYPYWFFILHQCTVLYGTFVKKETKGWSLKPAPCVICQLKAAKVT